MRRMTLCKKLYEIVQKTKYLGVQIDNSLDWNEHVKTMFSFTSAYR